MSTLLNALLFYIISTLNQCIATHNYGFNCTTKSPCNASKPHICYGEPCDIYCDGYHACNGATFQCPLVKAGSCKIYCRVNDPIDDSFISCVNTTFDGSKSKQLELSIEAQATTYNVTVLCPQSKQDGLCSVKCGDKNSSCDSINVDASSSNLYFTAGSGKHSMLNSVINGSLAMKLSVKGSGIESFLNATVICPKDRYIPCNLTYTAEFAGFTGMKLYSIHGINTLIMSCDDYVSGECYHIKSPPELYCSANYNESCSLQTHDGSYWYCEPVRSTCEDVQTRAPTLEPTIEPTAIPTVKPKHHRKPFRLDLSLDTNDIIWIGIGIAGSVFGIIFFIWFCRKRRQEKERRGLASFDAQSTVSTPITDSNYSHVVGK